jgi:hypothetical protein
MILDRLNDRIADLLYQNLCRPPAEPWRINGNGGERRLGVSCVLHIAEADYRELLAGQELVQREQVRPRPTSSSPNAARR